jgi:hypothetical protein
VLLQLEVVENVDEAAVSAGFFGIFESIRGTKSHQMNQTGETIFTVMKDVR